MVLGIVGGRTHGDVSRKAFDALISQFHTWYRVRDAAVREIHTTIQAVTHAERKASYLQGALRMITAKRQDLMLEFLRTWQVDRALSWLEQLPGVGRKTSAATLNFSYLRMKALVIDTHHMRVLRRLGIIGVRSNTVKAYDQVMPYLPADWTALDLDNHHQLIKLLGQKTCRHAIPVCRSCPLSDLCPTASTGLRRANDA
ncbi:MAG: hypothetical protein AAFY56_02985 [Pseudomonadota bacterium]